MNRENKPELSVVMPCLNEERTVGRCVEKALKFFETHAVAGEVVVADNGSTDRSVAVARSAGARVVSVSERGYGAALRGGIAASRGRFIVMGDADDSYDFLNLEPFLSRLRAGDDLVMGNRFAGGIREGAMPWHHRYLGNPVLSTLGRVIYKLPVRDFHCGLRGFSRDAFERLDLLTSGMEFASEMVVKAGFHGMRIGEVPIVLYPDGRGRPPHLRSWRDGWRHLRFLFLYSPDWLFLYPGIALIVIGGAVLALLARGPFQVGQVTFDVHTMLYASAAVMLGTQSVGFSVLAREFAIRERLIPERRIGLHPRFERALEWGILSGSFLLLGGLAGTGAAVETWRNAAFGNLAPREVLRFVIPSMLAIVLGFQLILTSFFLGFLRLKKSASPRNPSSGG